MVAWHWLQVLELELELELALALVAELTRAGGRACPQPPFRMQTIKDFKQDGNAVA